MDLYLQTGVLLLMVIALSVSIHVFATLTQSSVVIDDSICESTIIVVEDFHDVLWRLRLGM